MPHTIHIDKWGKRSEEDFYKGSGDGSLIRSIGIMKPSPNPLHLTPWS
jgi:hypothetical protein